MERPYLKNTATDQMETNDTADRRLGAFRLALAWVLSVLAGCSAEPAPAVYQSAAKLSAEVAAGRLDDCEALARFTEHAAGDPPEFIEAFNVFIPRAKANFPLGSPIGLVGVQAPVKLDGAVSGYRAEFRKEFEPGRSEGTAHDQAHHFAPYFILGAHIPRPIAEEFLDRAERPESWGDRNLGLQAIELGAAFAEGRLAAGDIGETIRATLCEGRDSRLPPP